MSIKHVISVSGGKDSAATLLLAIERFRASNLIPIFCDTGNEHQAVYDYLEYMESALGIKITRLRANFDAEIAAKRMFIARDKRTRRDKNGNRVRWSNKSKRRALELLHPTGNPFLDLCMWKGRFPSRKAQFCTEELKRNPAVEFQMALVDAGHTVVSWQGVRRDESQNRRNAKQFECIAPRMYHYRPLVEWTADQVFQYCASKSLKPNPLYLQGMGRVGCMPCINTSKSELRQIADRFPEHVARIAAWELLVSQVCKRGYSTFMHKGPGEHGAKTPRDTFEAGGIWQTVDWARTTRGGKQRDLLASLEDIAGCSSSYGLCDQGEYEAEAA